MPDKPDVEKQIADILSAMKATGSDGKPVFNLNEGERADIYEGLNHMREMEEKHGKS